MNLRNKLTLRRSGYERRKARWGWFFILPWLIGTVYFFVIPMIQAAIYAFNDVTMAGGTTQFEYVGFKNFIDLFWARSEQAISALAGKYGRLARSVAMNILRD